LPFTRY